MSTKKSVATFIRNQSLAAAFLVIEILAAMQIGFGHLLAWLLIVIAAWNACLLILGNLGVAMIAVKALNEKDN